MPRTPSVSVVVVDILRRVVINDWDEATRKDRGRGGTTAPEAIAQSWLAEVRAHYRALVRENIRTPRAKASDLLTAAAALAEHYERLAETDNWEED